MGRTAIFNREEMRKNQIVVPLNEREKTLIVEAAKKADMSMSAYVRSVLKKHFQHKKVN